MKKLVLISIALAAAAALYFALPGTLSFREAAAFLDSDAMATAIGETRISVFSALKLVVTLVAVLWAAALLSAFGQRRIRALKRLHSSSREILAKGLQILVYVLAFLIGVEVVGLDLTALAVVGGAAGIGIGFGLQKIASNFISGLILLIERSVRLGDLVEFSDGTTGFVRRLGARYTLIEGVDGRETLIPNEDFITSRVTSLTLSNRMGRVEIPVGVHYRSDLKTVQRILLEAAAEHPRCSRARPPVCFLRAFGASSVDFTLYFWVDDVEEGRLAPQSEVLFAIWDKFKQAGIEIPYPQQDLHIKELPGRSRRKR